MKQLHSPKYVDENAGWCLRATQRAFGITDLDKDGNNVVRLAEAKIYPTAWQAWEATKYKHRDRNFPKGNSVPVWFDWWGDVGDGWKRYGHAAYVHTDGKVYSSPLTGHGRAWFASVDDLMSAFGGMTYLGWSEDIAGVRVVEEETMKVDLFTARRLAYAVLGDKTALTGTRDKDLLKNHVGKELTPKYIEKLFDSKEATAARIRDTKLVQPGEAEKKLSSIKEIVK